MKLMEKGEKKQTFKCKNLTKIFLQCLYLFLSHVYMTIVVCFSFISFFLKYFDNLASNFFIALHFQSYEYYQSQI